MADSTILDLYKHDTDSPRQGHYTHYWIGGERSLDTQEFFRRTAAFAGGLSGLGVAEGDRVMLLSDNRPEWHMVDLAIASLGAISVPVYGTLNAEQIAYQAGDSGAAVAVVDRADQTAKFLRVRDRCPELRELVQIDSGAEDGVRTMDDVVGEGDGGGAGDRFWDRAKRVEPSDLLTLIYTSGTTGDPKGVRLTHANLVANVHAAAPRVPVGRDDLALEFLPLCHVLERMLGYTYMWRATDKAYCSVYDVGELISSIAPTIFGGVPRFYEKVYEKVMEQVATAPAVRRAVFQWAVDVGKEAAHKRIAGRSVGAALGAKQKVADTMVFGKIRDAFGGRVRYCISGGAALPLFVNELFHAVGVPVVEGYGLTETSPVIAVNGVEPGQLRLGTVGKPLDNVEVRLAEDGELLARGPSVMEGYWDKPDKTAEVFDDDGFFHTGDIAEIDDDGFVLITDRKKDILVTAGGKNVAPQPIENQLKRSSYVDNAVLVGDGRRYVAALISPNFEELRTWAEGQRLDLEDDEALAASPRVRELLQGVVDEVNSGLARYEQIKKFAVLPTMLSVEEGHLTPTLKVKRRAVSDEFRTQIEGLYAD